MLLTNQVEQILGFYESDNPGTKRNLAAILMSGKLAGTGKLVILPVDQGFEHGPTRSFAANPEAFDPYYHYNLAIEAGLSAYAAPLGMLEVGAAKFAGSIPLILKINSGNSLTDAKLAPNQAVTASVADAMRIGASAVGFTIYPGSDTCNEMINQFREIAREAKSFGLAVVVWSYPRGREISAQGETSLDVITYAAHMAALLGAHIIKVKLPTENIESPIVQKIFQEQNIPVSTLEDRVACVKQSCFAGKRILVFSGGASKSSNSILDEAKAIKVGGGNGSIIGRNCFQRPKQEALKLLSEIINIYLT